MSRKHKSICFLHAIIKLSEYIFAVLTRHRVVVYQSRNESGCVIACVCIKERRPKDSRAQFPWLTSHKPPLFNLQQSAALLYAWKILDYADHCRPFGQTKAGRTDWSQDGLHYCRKEILNRVWDDANVHSFRRTSEMTNSKRKSLENNHLYSYLPNVR